jgi:hypothetical protein
MYVQPLIFGGFIMAEYTIEMNWDAEAKVWYAVNDDIPIALESDSFDVLVERVRIAAPELLEANGAEPICTLRFVTERVVGVA